MNDDYLLLLTTGYTADTSGRPITDRLRPDVVVADADDRAISEILATPAVVTWLASARARTPQAISDEERRARCMPR